MNTERLAAFLGALPPRNRYAFEFRDPSWNTGEVLNLLGRHNAAYCSFDLAGYQSPIEITADFTYERLHGPGDKYQGSYSDKALDQWAARIAEWQAPLQAIYVYFDNDQAGYAARDALRLKALVGA